MRFDVSQLKDAPDVLAVKIAKNYHRHIKRCARLCVEAELEAKQENWPRARLLHDRSDMHEEMACEYGYLLGYMSDETNAFINGEIEVIMPVGCYVEYW